LVKVGVIAVAAFAAAMGARLAAFECDAANLKLGDAASRERLETWSASYGVAVTARNLIVDDPAQPVRAAARMLDVVHALELDPAAARLWLVYADQSWQMGLSADHVWNALDMAQLTGRREAEVMAFNALQTIRMWETADELHKERALSAISELRWLMLVERKKALLRALSSKSEAVRAEIARALSERLGQDKTWVKNVGL
jgi:hypothetical protein